jgi:hypothetical protein
LPAASMSSAAPRKCPWPNTSRWHKPSPHEKSPSMTGFLLVGAQRLSGSGEPVSRVEGAAHAQRQRRDVDELVSRHFLGRRVARWKVDAGNWIGSGMLSLVRPFCLAGVCRTGYRKE